MDKIFALDIGTRKVAGIIARAWRSDDATRPLAMEILDCELREHETRAMLAGQVHDIEKVAATVGDVKAALEARTGEPLTKVAVAVAGRALKTLRGRSMAEIAFDTEVSRDDVFNLEMAAVQEILGFIGKDSDIDFSEKFYCVGYSVISYSLDGAKMETLVGHKGSSISVEVLVTFLPRIVLESMLTVLKRTHLEVSSLTLEPIAAINIIIPKDMRRLNLALVDIGAGTSDIALTQDGSIIGYGMVTHAGDQITEKLCERYLVDFATGEYIKRSLMVQEWVSFGDIFGRTHNLKTHEVMSEMVGAVSELSKQIAKGILELNSKAPHAVVCVGGGSRTFGLQEKIAEALGLASERVGIRGPEMIMNVKDLTAKLTGPEAVTPLGISAIAGQKQGLEFINVRLNGKKVPLLNINQNLNVLAALVAGGINTKKLHAKPGLSRTYEMDGEIGIIKGTLGTPASVTIAGEKARLDSFIHDNDDIVFEPALDGENGRATAGEVIGEDGMLNVTINGSPATVMPEIFINGEKVSFDTEVPDRARIEVFKRQRLQDVLTGSGFHVEEDVERSIMITVNSQPRILTQQSYSLSVNSVEVSLDEEMQINDGDIIDYNFFESTRYQLKDVVGIPRNGRELRVKVNGENFIFKGEEGKIFMNGESVSADTLVPNGADIRTQDGKDAKALFVDIFRFISLKTHEEVGKKLMLRLDGREAQFTSVLADGSDVNVYFE
ncbi:MAG: hypothetical protein ABH868_02550 [bacterium]